MTSDFKEPEPLAKGFTDNQYWRSPDILGDASIEDLLADYEWLLDAPLW